MIQKYRNWKKKDGIWEIYTNQGVFKTKYVVNAAGVYADKFHNMVSEKKYTSHQEEVIIVCWIKQQAHM